jgi:hypothetical protein
MLDVAKKIKSLVGDVNAKDDAKEIKPAGAMRVAPVFYFMDHIHSVRG